MHQRHQLLLFSCISWSYHNLHQSFLFVKISCSYLLASVVLISLHQLVWSTCISCYSAPFISYSYKSASVVILLPASAILINLHQPFYLSRSAALIFFHQLVSSTCISCSCLPLSAVLLYLHQLMEIAGCNDVTSSVLTFHQIKNLSRHIHVRGTNIRVYRTEMLQTHFCRNGTVMNNFFCEIFKFWKIFEFW